MARRKFYQDETLKNKALSSFEQGYNSFASGKSTVKDKEIPYGQNVIIGNNGGARKRAGSDRFGPEIVSGKAIRGIGNLKNSSHNKLIVAAGTNIYNVTSSSKTVLTGMTMTDDKPTDFMQANDKLYFANGADNLAYTDDGSTITEITSNGNIGRWPVFYNQRIYMTNTANPDRIYYSNPYAIDLTANPPTLTWTDFHTFNTDLSATPKKNAGYIALIPGAGVEITRLKIDSQSGIDYIFAYTKNHGIWRIAYDSVNSDGSIAHSVIRLVSDTGCPAGDSVVKVANDQWYFGKDNFYTLGEVVNYQNVRITPKTGRVKTEVDSISSSGIDSVAGGFFKDKLYYSYRIGSYNDRIIIYDTRFNAYSTPISGINANQFFEWTDTSDITRFLVGSSDPSDSYIYQIETGSNDVSTAINGYFETKSTDCDRPGLIKRFAFIDVFYTSLFGTISYEVFIDETSSITGEQQIGNSTDIPSGIGSLPIGKFPIGAEYDANTDFADLAQNSSFRIPTQYKPGKKISVRFSNDNTGEQFEIDGIRVWFIEGDVYEN